MTDWHEHNKNFGKSQNSDKSNDNDNSISAQDYGKLIINQSDNSYDFEDNFSQNDTPNSPNSNQQFFNGQTTQESDQEIEVEIEVNDPDENDIIIEPDTNKNEEKSKKRDQNSRIKQKLQEINDINSKLQEENIRLKKTTIDKIDESFHLNHKNIKTEYEKLLAERKYFEDRAYSWEQEFKNARINNDIDAESEALKKRSEYERNADFTNERLSKVKAASENLISEYENFQKNVTTLEKDIMARPQVQNIDDYDDEKAENFKEFMHKNSYLDDTFDNPNFSPEIVAEVSKISAEISRNYKLNNAGDKIGSREYFNDVQSEIDRILRKEKSMEKRTIRKTSSRTAPVSSENNKRITMRESEHKFLLNVQNEIAKAFPEQKNELNNSFQKSFLNRLKNY